MIIPEPQPDSPTWPTVLAFAKLMEHKLSLNRHKGDREAWLRDFPLILSRRILDEHEELVDQLEMGPSDISPSNCALEAADIANFAMMTADSATNGKLL